MTDLEARIKGFANAAEDKIEFGLREAMIAEDETQRGKAHEELCESLQQIVKDIDLVQEESKKIQDHRGRQASTWSMARDTSSKKLPNLEVSNKSSKLLGWEALARQLQQNNFQVIIAKAYVNIVDMTHASVASLMRTIESLLTSNSPMQSITCDHSEDFSALHEKVSSLEVFLKNFEKNNVSGEMTDFEVEVKEVTSAVEYTIQLRLTETIMEKNKSIIGITGSKFFKGISNIWTRRKFRKSLQQLAKDIDCVWKESTKIQDKGKQVSEGSLVQDFSCSTNDILNVNNNMVGRDDQKEHLLEDLTGSYSGEPKIIPIAGMGGIGKTTLAKEVYNHGSMLRRCDVRAWATVSQQHNIKEILLSLLQSTIKMDDMVKMKGEAELADLLQKSLKRKRYLIVLDDI
ncbi:hypothetical protein CQW23_33918 [Capsicum baccatum]|uniref:NB-ARC domain-containing protein n=1 Tax=Capsicum baccatum TaxID=33114 RepID=A0A2G2V0C4_CAPBA|nr:hypothetical protein CQW23_33918 [Capsicum baccatum]